MTTVRTWPDHLLSLAEWDALPEDTSRHVELVEGVLLVSPRAVVRHQRVVTALAAALNAHLRPDRFALAEVEVVVDRAEPPTVRVPDLSIVREATIDDRPRLYPEDVIAVVEVLSPGSRRTDRVLKLAEYADAGIRHYLLVEPGPPVSMIEFELTGGTYEQVAEHHGPAALRLLPDGATIDPGTL